MFVCHRPTFLPAPATLLPLSSSPSSSLSWWCFILNCWMKFLLLAWALSLLHRSVWPLLGFPSLLWGEVAGWCGVVALSFSPPILTLSSDSTRCPARATMTTTSRLPPEQHERSADANVRDFVLLLRQACRSEEKQRQSSFFYFHHQHKEETAYWIVLRVKGHSKTKRHSLHYAKNRFINKLWWIILLALS